MREVGNDGDAGKGKREDMPPPSMNENGKPEQRGRGGWRITARWFH